MKKFLPLLLLLVTLLFVIATNISRHTYLMGWDNLLPELNLAVHSKRSFFAVWEEFQGLGLLAGNGHPAELPRLFLLWIFSLALPINLIRQAYMFLMLAAGSIGTYALVKKLLGENHSSRWSSSIASLFYLLNLITVQTFYAPFEPFITQYGMLPWLLYGVVGYILKPSNRRLLLFVLITVISIPQGQVPTVFIVYIGALSIMLLIINLTKKTRCIKQSMHILIATLLINAFWLLPFFYFSSTNASVAVNAKINQQTTENVFLQNKEFGTFYDVVLLKGFWFNNTDLNQQREFSYMMQPWRNWTDNPMIVSLGFLLFATIIWGVLVFFFSTKNHENETKRSFFFEVAQPYKDLLPQQKTTLLGFLLLFLVSTSLLLIATPPFSWLNGLLRDWIPFFNQVFRFPFTKISILASLTYSVFLGIGIHSLCYYLRKYTRGASIARVTLVILVLLISLPIFSGNLFYNKERIILPSEYQDLFSFFSKEDPDTRIANFPQPTFWGWTYYSWGYGGSGFLWHGIRQPLLDRAFDVWSQSSENYYHEVSQALYAKNPELLENIFHKYQVRWALVDGNVIYPPSPKALFNEELHALLAQIPGVKKERQFGRITVYSVDLERPMQSFISTSTALPTVNNYHWNNYDQAYSDLGNYRTETSNADAYYPFRSLLSNRSQKDIAFSLSLTKDSISLEQYDIPFQKGGALLIPSYFDKETIVPTRLFTTKEQNGMLDVKYEASTPSVLVNGKVVWAKKQTDTLFTILPEATSANSSSSIFPLKLNVNGLKVFIVDNNPKNLGTTFLSTRQDNTFTLSSRSTQPQAKAVPSSILKDGLGISPERIVLNPETNNTIQVDMQLINDSILSFTPDLNKIDKVENCNKFRNGNYSALLNAWDGVRGVVLDGTNASACISFFSNNLPHDQGYAIFTKTSYIRGKSLSFWIENIDQKYATIDTFLPKGEKNKLSTIILPPQDKFGKAYSFHFDNTSIGNDETTNLLSSLSVYPIAYNFISGLMLTSLPDIQVMKQKGESTLNELPYNITHPNESLYILRPKGQLYQKENTIILSQSFDNGWSAYLLPACKGPFQKLCNAFPFLLGKSLSDHFIVNNWENGWTAPSMIANDSQIVIVYLPQYLEYTGFVLLTGYLLGLTYFLTRKGMKLH